MEYARNLIVKKDGRFDLDESKLNIFLYDEEPIPAWEPDVKLPDYTSLTSVFCDIETYSNNEMVYDDFIERWEYGRLYDHDSHFVRFTTKLIDGYMSDADSPMWNACNLTPSDILILKKYLLKRFKAKTINTDHDTNPVELALQQALITFLEYHKEVIINYEKDIDPKGALNPLKAKIVLIGVMNEKGRHYIFDCQEYGEKEALKQFFKVLHKKKPDIIAFFNGFSFDLPFIKHRAHVNNVKYPFYVSKHEKTFRSAQKNGKPQVYLSHWYNHGDTAVVDCFHMVLAEDFVKRNMTSHTLKSSPLQMKLRKEARLDLPYAEMKRCIETGDMDTLKEYLYYDLEDTKLLCDYLLPSYYYQKEILPNWQLHSLVPAGMGTKWNDRVYYENKKVDPMFFVEPDNPVKYEGGLTGAYAGFYKNVSKIDVASLYPTIMLLYGICSCKDTLRITLGILKFLKDKRIGLKKEAKLKKGTHEGLIANQRQGSYKIFINSGYGVLGVTGKAMNDYEAATLVTAYGRAILREMVRLIELHGGTICSIDTDGVYYTCGTLERNREVHQLVQDGMPGNAREKVLLDYELECDAFYVPRGEDGEGLRKNYIMIVKEKNKDTGEIEVKVKAKGKYVKRDNYKLKNEFIPNLIKAYNDGKHEEYYQEVLYQLTTRTIPIDKLSVTRKIKKNEVRLVEIGVGEPEEVVTIYRCEDEKFIGKRGQVLKKTKPVWSRNPDDLDIKFYVDEVKKDYASVMDSIYGDEPIAA